MQGFLRAVRLQIEAFHGLPGSELNHLTKPFKMDLQLTNRRFNFDKFRFCIILTCQMFDGSYQDYLDGVAYLMKAG